MALKRSLAILTGLVASAPFVCLGQTPRAPGPICTTVRPPSYCGDPTKPVGALCAQLPHDVNFKVLQNGYSTLNPICQQPFDDFSWQNFVALNWPVKELTTPRPWENYADPEEIFNPTAIAKIKTAAKAPAGGMKLLYRTSKEFPLPGEPPSQFLEATGQPLIDRNMNFALYEERVNPNWVTYITTTAKLATKAQQTAFVAAGKIVKFPAGFYLNDTQGTGGQMGTMEIKATWRILDASKGDRLDRFYTRKATIYIEGSSVVGCTPNSCPPLVIPNVTVGLVALHMNIMTKDGKGSVWGTFEQEDNDPPQGQKPDPSKVYSFFNLACTACVPNTPPKLIGTEKTYMWSRTAPYAQRYSTAGKYGTQVTMVNPAYPETTATNQRWQKMLAGTVWSHYFLVGTQWTNDEDPPPTQGIPPVLANTTLETYVPQNKASCLSCHYYAPLAVPAKNSISGDFSYLLRHAQ